jgi:hypothetical protein
MTITFGLHSGVTMKNLCGTHRLDLLVASILIFLMACNNGDDPAPVNQGGCKLQSEMLTGSGPAGMGVTFTHTVTSSYTYDDKGNNVNWGTTNNYNYSDGKSIRLSSTRTQEYDNDDFVTRSFSQSSSTYQDGKTSVNSNDVTYTYANGRLSKATYISTADGVSNTNSNEYKYDSQGRIVEIRSSTNAYVKFDYIGATGYKVTRVDINGNSATPLLEFNGAGLIVKTVDTQFGVTDEQRYQYNAEGQMIRIERYTNGKPTSADETEYDNKESTFSLVAKLPKGHPKVPTVNGSGVNKHNPTKVTRFQGNPDNGQWEAKEVVTYMYEYNGNNFPTKATIKTVDKDGIEISTETNIIAYEGCP